MMYNPSGFDPQGLDMNADLGDPRRQEKLPGGYATQGQAVSAPYAEANMKAAEKTNPMNAASQMPEQDFLDGYVAQMSEKDIDKMLIKEINKGSFGSGQRLQDAKNTMINRISGAGVPLRGV